MNGTEIKQLLVKDWRVLRVFKGVFACDTLPQYIQQGKAHAFVINTDPAHKPGSHWVALYIDAFGSATYFDSMGLEPFKHDIYPFSKRNSFKLISNVMTIQSVISATCGLYCIYFIRQMVRGARLRDIIQHFNPLRPVTNDRLIIALVHR